MSHNFIHKKGDTFKSVNFEVVGNPILPSLSVVKMQLRKECGEVIALSLTSDLNAGITITNAVAGLFKINTQIIDIPKSMYIYDIQLTFSDGMVKTWLSGFFTIECDITQ